MSKNEIYVLADVASAPERDKGISWRDRRYDKTER
jgi:hypothetical protein